MKLWHKKKRKKLFVSKSGHSFVSSPSSIIHFIFSFTSLTNTSLGTKHVPYDTHTHTHTPSSRASQSRLRPAEEVQPTTRKASRRNKTRAHTHTHTYTHTASRHAHTHTHIQACYIFSYEWWSHNTSPLYHRSSTTPAAGTPDATSRQYSTHTAETERERDRQTVRGTREKILDNLRASAPPPSQLGPSFVFGLFAATTLCAGNRLWKRVIKSRTTSSGRRFSTASSTDVWHMQCNAVAWLHIPRNENARNKLWVLQQDEWQKWCVCVSLKYNVK